MDTSLESILNKNKELIPKRDDSTRKFSSLEEFISVANQPIITEEVKRGKTLFGCKSKGRFQFLQKP